VGDLARDSNLATQSFEPHRVARKSHRKELERYRRFELQVVGPEDLAHPAAPEGPDDSKTTDDQPPGGEVADAGCPVGKLLPRIVTRRVRCRQGWCLGVRRCVVFIVPGHGFRVSPVEQESMGLDC